MHALLNYTALGSSVPAVSVGVVKVATSSGGGRGGGGALAKIIIDGKRIPKMTDTTLQTITITLSMILMPTVFFCLVPVLVIAMMARTRAGMVHVRQMR